MTSAPPIIRMRESSWTTSSKSSSSASTSASSKNQLQVNDYGFAVNSTGFLVAYEWKASYGNLPSKWNATRALTQLLSRLTEDRVSVSGLQSCRRSAAPLAALDQAIQHPPEAQIFGAISRSCRIGFWSSLLTPVGQSFVNGDGSPGKPAIRWVLVDEYHVYDLMQDAIDFALAAPTRTHRRCGWRRRPGEFSLPRWLRSSK